MKAAVAEQSHVERSDDVDKDKKKKRRSSRRSKQNSSTTIVSGSINGLQSESTEIVGSSGMTNEQQLPKASNVAFNSLPTMHITENAAPSEGSTVENQQLFFSDFGGMAFSKSCPETISSEDPMEPYGKDFIPTRQPSHQQKYFTPHRSTEAINEALEKGQVFKALFRVNAHNRLEAYCKIDGVATDVLISGIAAQNRAVEGDIVAIKVDPLCSWTKMKGSAGTSNNFASPDDHSCASGVTELATEKGLCYAGGTSSGTSVALELTGRQAPGVDSRHSSINGHCSSQLDFSQAGFLDQNAAAVSLEKLCAMINSFPSKRPTGKVLGIIERSHRRDAVVGFLSVKQCLLNRNVSKKDKKKKNSSSLNHESVMLMPTDPKFPKMSVFVRDLPDVIKKRLDDGDSTIEKELVGARIDDWGEESYIPQAQVLHIFGRGGEIEPQIAAILFENTIHLSEFSPESLSCIPHISWKVPSEELRTRRDLRNLCIFTIDPSTAREFDDALSVERLSNGNFKVGVHIADVSYFVLPDTALDREAQIRSTSVYLLRDKIPMLPSLFSENLGSLNPGVDRLAFSIFWDINLAGEVLDQWVGRTVIRSCCKLSYENVQDIIDGLFDNKNPNSSKDGFPQIHGDFECSDVIKCVKSLCEISRTLKDKRFNNGALRLESSKLAFLFDEDGIPYDSEFMLLANTTVAEIIFRAYPDSALLRRHPEPNIRKLREFEAFCNKHGLELDITSSGRLHNSLERIKETLKNDSLLFNILISYASKPMQLAKYFCSGDLKDAESDCGHYALAVPLYTHFTSPLRRYPDILVHRTLAAAIEAEEMYLKCMTLQKLNNRTELTRRCFTGICFDKDAAESIEGREALSAAAAKYRVPCAEILADVAACCNERKLASRNVKDSSDKLYAWVLLKKKEILLTEARVLGLGPRFMSIYVQKLAIERRIYYDEVEEMTVEWLDATSALVLSLSTHKRFQRRNSPGKCRTIEDVALVVSPVELALGFSGDIDNEESIGSTSQIVTSGASIDLGPISECSSLDATEVDPAAFPLTVRLLSTIPVALHAVGGDDGPLDIGVRLYMSSYFR
ncbi:Exoribonuclease II [Bertholletia excelsa]